MDAIRAGSILQAEALAAGQLWVISAAEAAVCGLDAHDVDVLCRRGEWTRVRRGFYSPRPAPPDPREREMLDFAAAVRAIDAKDAAIAHISAGRAWGAKWLAEPDNSEVWVACDAPATSRHYSGLRILPAGLPAQDVTLLEGLPVSTPARTAVDLARHLSFDPAVVVVDSLRFKFKIADEELAAILERCRGWPFIRRARRAILFSTTLAESPLESQFRIEFARVGLPASRLQAKVIDANGDERRLDHLFGLRAGVEIDGRMKYRTPEDLWEEKRREDALRRAGYPLLRLTAEHLRIPGRALRQMVINHMISTGDCPP